MRARRDGGMVDAADSKSAEGNLVGVRLPLPAPLPTGPRPRAGRGRRAGKLPSPPPSTRGPVDIEICESPVIIIGSPRSGTTALAWALDKHPDLAAFGESQVLVDLFAGGSLDRNYKREGKSSFLRRHGIGPDQFLADVGLGLNRVLTRAAGGKRWVDQTPRHTLMLQWLPGMFPGAQFIHILRDGRRVVHSMVNKSSRFAGKGTRWAEDFAQSCRSWVEYCTAATDFERSHPDRCITVRNEELVQDPERGFRHILAFLDLPYHPAPAEFFAGNRLNSSFGPNAEGIGAVDTLTDPWSEWDAERKRVFREIAGEAMQAYGLATLEELAVP
jgi:hypothetical protein